MRAVIANGFGGPEVLEVVETAVPEPGPGQVRVRVRAAALNPVDAAVRAGVFGGGGERIGFGWDVAGEIDALGPGVGAGDVVADGGAGAARWAVGDRVVGLHYGAVKALGTHAEFVVLDVGALAAAPVTVDDAHAAVLPLSGLTAARSLAQSGLRAGDSVLITGAAGVVGGLAVQLAARAGLVVTALAGEADEELVRSLGAARFVPRGGAVEPGSVDGVLDFAVLGEPALEWVRDGGAYVGVHPGAEPAPVRGVRVGAQEVAADGAHLAQLVALVDAGGLTLRVGSVHALADAAEAHAVQGKGGVRGRVVLVA
ncbi:NADP-dependent oxidoreductase [Streptomyces sp. NRRL S-87]|uniref:NADP-dependent oxidoreductase n=1 Tax=Streptomyces sp. NRRL S-87 TaxID=1463920 RepID=UPI0004C0DB9D|nr:NADP-dependent oxidoreductase [Streptomyces sp. NRRL S-87]